MVSSSVPRTSNKVRPRGTERTSDDRFHAAMVHDLKAPVRTGQQLLAMLAKRHGDEDPALWQAAVATMETLAGRVDAILRFSEASGARLTLGPVDTNALARKAAVQVQRDHGRALPLRVQRLPPCCGDEGMIEQVFYNLIDNAVKYGHGGCIEVGGRITARGVQYWVHDDGPGIPETMARRIFEPFRRGPGSLDVEGHGLGLAVVERIVQRHGGRVDVADGPGATVRVDMPRRPLAAP